MTTLTGFRAIVTAGPTIEAIDPVRFLSNRSSGKQGYAIAQCLAEAGADVVLVSGPTCLDVPAGVARVNVESADAMLAAVDSALPADIFISVAAVADWKPVAASALKTEKSEVSRTLELVENPDILQRVSRHDTLRPILVIGFAAETHDVLTRARAKRLRKGCDWLVANDVTGDAMGGDDNEFSLITGTDEVRWPRDSKLKLAARLVDAIKTTLAKA